LSQAKTCYANDMKVVSLVIALCAGGCATTHAVAETEPTVSVAPDEFVLRDVRRDAAQRTGCQAPAVELEWGPWSGSEGNVMAYSCGYQLTYYLRCQTSHQCLMTRSD
jgi:hypothetical protein